MRNILLLLITGLLTLVASAQKRKPVFDNFDKDGTISWWSYGKDSPINQSANDPTNATNKVLHFAKNTKGLKDEYNGVGASFIEKFNLNKNGVFKCEILFPVTSKNKKIEDKTVKFRLVVDNDNFIQIEKKIEMSDEWQTLTFDFKNDKTFTKGRGATRKGMDKMIFDFSQSSGATSADYYIDNFLYERNSDKIK